MQRDPVLLTGGRWVTPVRALKHCLPSTHKQWLYPVRGKNESEVAPTSDYGNRRRPAAPGAA